MSAELASNGRHCGRPIRNGTRLGAALASVAATVVFGASTAAASCAPLPCSQVIVRTPYLLSFDRNHGGVLASGGIGTGFTYVDRTSAGDGYAPERLFSGNGVLTIRTRSGIDYGATNSLENGLAVGVRAATTSFTVQTTLDRPPAGTGRWEQGGVRIGTGQDTYVKLVRISTPQGPTIQLLGERLRRPPATGAVTFASRSIRVAAFQQAVTLILRADTETRTVSGHFSPDGGQVQDVGTFRAPVEVLSLQAGELAGSRFAGVFATHRRGAGPLDFRFASFALCTTAICPVPGPGGGPTPHEPKPLKPGAGPNGRPRPGSGGPSRRVVLRGSSGSLNVTLRHPRRVRIPRLIKRGLRLRLSCSEACAMRSGMFGRGRWARGRGVGVKRTRLQVGARRVRLQRAGVASTRVRVRSNLKARLRKAKGTRLVITARVTGARGASVRLRGVVIARR